MKFSVLSFYNFVAILGGMIGSLLMASGYQYAGYGFMFFLASSLGTIGIQRTVHSQRGLMFLNYYFIAVNIYGLLVYFKLF